MPMLTRSTVCSLRIFSFSSVSVSGEVSTEIEAVAESRPIISSAIRNSRRSNAGASKLGVPPPMANLANGLPPVNAAHCPAWRSKASTYTVCTSARLSGRVNRLQKPQRAPQNGICMYRKKLSAGSSRQSGSSGTGGFRLR
ncbi:hypothetical protein D3C75_981150 [compost metagenome]